MPSSATFPAREGSGGCIPEWLIIAPRPIFCNTSTFHLLTHVSGTDVYRHILFYWYNSPTADYILWPPSAALHRLHAIRVLLTFKQPGHFDREK